jgi:alpha-methylacyl-CoA racemase
VGQGPFAGVRVLEFAGKGPGPFCAMLLSDLGADVVEVDRPGSGTASGDVVRRGRRSITLDLKDSRDRDLCLEAIARADVLIEGFRPGVMERLGLGPEGALERNPRLIYGRMTGWGQSGPLAHAAGHDINYIALAGALEAMGPKRSPPPPPLNLVGDYGGGALYLAFGVAAALYERERSGRGQVIDAAIVDGTASLMAVFCGFAGMGLATGRGRNLLDGSAPFYRTYECSDGRYVSVGPLEPEFYDRFLSAIGVDPATLGPQASPGDWERASGSLEALFRTRTREEWRAVLEGSDACFAPVLSLEEAPTHPHLRAREVYEEHFGVVQPNPAPRFSRTPGRIQGAPPRAGEGGVEALRAWGVPVEAPGAGER